MHRPRRKRRWPLARRCRSTGLVTFGLLLLVAPLARSQSVEVRNRSRAEARGLRLQDTLTVSSKGWSFGWTNTLAAGRPLGNAFATRYDIGESTKVWFHTSLRGLDTEWEAKLNHEIGKLRLDGGFGSDGLFHAGARYGPKRKKGFGFELGVVRQRRGIETSFEIWQTVESLDLTATLQHRRGRLGWSVTSNDFLKGVLRYETTSTRDGSGNVHQLVWGQDLRTGQYRADHEPLDFFPDDRLFGDDAIKVKSPLVDDEPELAWMVHGSGGRLQQTHANGSRRVSAEAVRYLNETLWVGGVWSVKNGRQEGVDVKFGSTGESLNLATTVGYSIAERDVSGSVSLRWRPGAR